MRHLLSIDDLSDAELELLTRPTFSTEPLRTRKGLLACLFEQPSLRTASTFAAAGVSLGLTPIFLDARGHAVREGVSLADELHQLGFAAQAVVVRTHETLERAALAPCERPVINAGDGANEHPTQALIDVTAMRSLGLLERRVTLMGNLRDHRTHHSLAKALRRLGVALTLVAPPGLAMDERHAGELTTVTTDSTDDIDSLLAETGCIYMTPVAYWDEPHRPVPAGFHLNLERAQRVLRPGTKVLHPFPRHGELCPSMDTSPFNGYHDQVRRAVPVRSRLLDYLLGDRA